MSSSPYRPPAGPPSGYPRRRGAGDPLLIAIAVLVVAVIAGGGGYLIGKHSAKSTPSARPGGTSSASAPPSQLGSAPASGDGSAVGSAEPSLDEPAAASPPPGTLPVAPATAVPPTAALPSRTPSPTVTSPPAHPDPDFGYVTGVLSAGSVTKITFDRATLLTGAAAASAAKAHGQEAADDYFIVNDNPLIRTFELVPGVVVTGTANLSGSSDPTPSTLAALKAWLDGHPKQHLPVDLGYDAAGKIAKIAEVYFP